MRRLIIIPYKEKLSKAVRWRQEFWVPAMEWLFKGVEWEGERVLDFGCGYGDMTYFLYKEHKAQVIGLDINKRAIEVAQKKYGEKIDFLLHQKGKVIPFPDEYFDIIFIKSVLWSFSLPSLSFYLREFYRILKSGGNFLVIENNRGPFLFFIIRFFLHKGAAWSIKRPYFTRKHLKLLEVTFPFSHVRFLHFFSIPFILLKLPSFLIGYSFKIDSMFSNLFPSLGYNYYLTIFKGMKNLSN